MGNRDKPFVVYRGGLTNFLVVPRGIKGWTQFVVWLAMLTPAVIWFVEHVDSRLPVSDYGSGIILFALGVVAWLIGGVWWMLAHAQSVNVVELERERHYQRMERRREKKRASGQESASDQEREG